MKRWKGDVKKMVRPRSRNQKKIIIKKMRLDVGHPLRVGKKQDKRAKARRGTMPNSAAVQLAHYCRVKEEKKQVPHGCWWGGGIIHVGNIFRGREELVFLQCQG